MLQNLDEQELNLKRSKQESDLDYISMPVVQGFQSNQFYWMTRLRFDQLAEMLHPFFNRNTPEDPLDLAQRSLDPKRARKIASYVVDSLSVNRSYILPPVILTIQIPEEGEFEFDNFEIESDNVPAYSFSEIGILSIPADSTFWLPDGQHRIAGAIEAMRIAPGLTSDETIGVMLIPDDEGGQKRQQIFLDINQHCVKPNKSIISLFDYRDPDCDVAREVLISVPIFNGRTALEATNLRSNSGDLFTLNSLRDACRILTRGFEGDRVELAISFWNSVANCLPDWKKAKRSSNPASVRSGSIAFTALAMSAIAMVGRSLLEKDKLDLIANLKLINWSVDNSDWNGIIKFSDRIVKNNRTIEDFAEYIEARL